MADTKISALPVVTVLTAADQLVVVQAGATSGITQANMAATAAEVTTGTSALKFATPKAIKDAGIVVTPVKATGAEVTTGTDDAKFATPKAIRDAGFSTGVYTPTLYNTTNVTASTSFECQWLRVLNKITVWGQVVVDPTAAGTNTILGMSLPVASAITVAEQLAGVGANIVNNQSWGIYADTVNDRALFRTTVVSDINQAVFFSFSYIVV